MENLGGPILFGYCLDIFLYGILTVQTYIYYLAFPHDRRATKAIVYFVYIFGTIQMALALRDFYTIFCTPQGNVYLESRVPDLDRFGFMWFTIPVDSALVAFVVQFFYAHRIYVISRSRIITAVVSILAFLPFIGGLLAAVWSFGPPRLEESTSTTSIILIIGTASGISCDLLIAVYMSYYLSRQMKGTSRTTQVFVTKIVRLLLETGILTVGMTVACTILSFLRITTYEYMAPNLSLGKLYTNSMLVLLNNRFTINGGRNTPHPDFDIPSYRRTDLAEVQNARPALSHGIAFAHSRRAETTLSSGETHTIELNLQQERAARELEGGQIVKGGDEGCLTFDLAVSG